MTIPFARPYFSETARKRIAADIDAILASGELMLGAQKDRFEAAFRDLVGSPHAVSVNSCTTALTICLRHFGAAGGEVLVPAASFLTDVSAVLFAGATPVLVDIDPETLAFDLDDLERKITDATAGLIWVHLVGLITDQYERLLAIAKTNGLFVIEDASHAHGAAIDGRPAGSIGDAGCFSFYPTKIVTSGTGGMLTTADESLKRYAEEMRLFGKEAETGEVIHLGNDWFLDEIRACVGYHHVAELPWRLERRRAIAGQYTERLANQPGLRLLRVPMACQPAWYQYPVFLDPGIDRARLIARLKSEHAIPTKAIYKPIHEEQIFRDYADKSLGNAEATLQTSLCLPMFEMLGKADVERIAEALVTEVRAAR